MEFEATFEVWVEPSDLQEMKRLIQKEGAPPHAAFHQVASGWEDSDYYLSPYIEDSVIEFLLKEDFEECLK